MSSFMNRELKNDKFQRRTIWALQGYYSMCEVHDPTERVSTHPPVTRYIIGRMQIILLILMGISIMQAVYPMQSPSGLVAKLPEVLH